MANFLFWLFTLAAALLIPACMLYLGRRFQTRPPRNINMGYGYRSHRSMQSQEAWDFAQVYSGRFWVRVGRPVLAVSLVWMLLLFDRDIGTVGTSAVVLMGIQMLPFLAVIPATERVLRRKFG
ncbi:MAG: SdpI family protein [Oscillibacter sp.]|jgi:uncharacterized membrane protein|nr:SdpI family protein [Oscillibacter sp.]